MPAAKQKKEIYAHIRWMIRRDMEKVLEIEQKSFEFPWGDDDFLRCLRQRNCIGIVAEYKDYIVGFMIYELNKKTIRVLNFAVHPDYRRQSVGGLMVQKLITKLSLQGRSKITLEVRETNLDAQLFFRKCGFKAVNILRNFYEETSEDAYVMQRKYAEQEAISASADLSTHLAG